MLVQIVSVRFILHSELSSYSSWVQVGRTNDTDSSQGRIDPNFQDDNHELISTLLSRHDKCSSLEVRSLFSLSFASQLTHLRVNRWKLLIYFTWHQSLHPRYQSEHQRFIWSSLVEQKKVDKEISSILRGSRPLNRKSGKPFWMRWLVGRLTKG